VDFNFKFDEYSKWGFDNNSISVVNTIPAEVHNHH